MKKLFVSLALALAAPALMACRASPAMAQGTGVADHVAHRSHAGLQGARHPPGAPCASENAVRGMAAHRALPRPCALRGGDGPIRPHATSGQPSTVHPALPA